jgi:hypothetical protein
MWCLDRSGHLPPSVMAIIDPDYTVTPCSVAALTKLHQAAFGETPTEEAQRKVVESYLKMHYSAGRIINAASDMEHGYRRPGKKMKRLDDRVAKTVRAPYVIKKGDDLVWICHTYMQVGGEARKYTFTFKGGTLLIKVTWESLGTGLGNVHFIA